MVGRMAAWTSTSDHGKRAARGLLRVVALAGLLALAACGASSGAAAAAAPRP